MIVWVVFGEHVEEQGFEWVSVICETKEAAQRYIDNNPRPIWYSYRIQDWVVLK